MLLSCMQKKICIALMTHTIDGRSASGTAVVATKCIEALLARPEEFELTFIHFERSDEEIYKHGVREEILPAFRIGFFNRRFFRQTYYFITTKDRFDIIHWFQPRLYPFFWLAPAKRIVVTVHGAGDFTPENKFIFSRFVHNWTLRLSRKHVSVAIAGSEYAKNDIVRYYHLDPVQVIAVNNGADASFVPARPEAIARVRERYQLPEKFFLGVGRFISSKNVPRILQAFDEFCEKSGNADMRFVNIGAKGMEKPAVDAVVAASPYKERISFVPYVEQEDLPVFYSAAYALVFPLLNEGFGLPAVEAMACGTPAIISETAAPEITSDDAMLVDALDVHDISRAMREIAADPSLRERLKKSGKAKADTFTWKATGDKVIAIYKELMERKN